MPGYDDYAKKRDSLVDKHAGPYTGIHESDQPGVRYMFQPDGVHVLRDGVVAGSFPPGDPMYEGYLKSAKSGYYKLVPPNTPAVPGNPADTNFRVPK